MRRQANASAVLILCAAAAWGQSPYGKPEAVRNVGIDQKLNNAVPLDLTFNDEQGRSVPLRQFFSGNKPVLLSLVYYECPMLCNLVLNGQASTMKHIGLEAGRDYEAVTVSFDPRETPATAAAKKAAYLEKLGQPGAAGGWHFLTGNEENIQALADAMGFRYAWDERTKQWGHSSAIMVLTPDGRVSRYLFGINYPKRDLRLALVEASDRKIGNATDQILLLCYHYDPAQGRYSVAVINTMRVAGTATAMLIGAFVFINLRRDRRGRKA